VSSADMDKLLPPSTLTLQPPSTTALRRLRVFVKRVSYASERCFVLRRLSEIGSLKWQCEY
jgi:hypothetical protein